MQSDLAPLLKRARGTVKFYHANDDAYENLEKDAKDARGKSDLVAYHAETACRWSSALTSLETVVCNNYAHGVSRAKHFLSFFLTA